MINILLTMMENPIAQPNMLALFLSMLVGSIVIISIISIALYIYNALVFQTIAKKLNYKKPWLAWIPIFNMFLYPILAKKHWALGFLFIIPFVNIIIYFIFLWTIFKRRGYSGALSLIQVIPIIGSLGHLVVLGVVAWKDKKDVITQKEPPKEENKPIDKQNLKDVPSQKTSILTYLQTFFTSIYFFFEDIYYSILDKINNVVPINKTIDKIDTFAPSFVVFIVFIMLVVYLLFFANIFISEYSFNVNVTDDLGNTISNASVSLYRNDELLIQQNTDVFGIAEFYNVRAKSVTINAEKEEYVSKEEEIKLSKKTNFINIVLPVDANFYLAEYDTLEKTRTISFVTTNELIITEKLNVSFSCSNPAVTPDPTSKQTTSGQIVVKQPARCGALRYSVLSNSFEDKTSVVVPENNKIFLERISTNKGDLLFNVVGLNNNALPNSTITIYQSSIPNVAFSNGLTDIYGKYVFNIKEGNYLYSASKQGYISVPKTTSLEVFKDNTTRKNVMLLTAEDIENFDCSDPAYSEYCINNEIDCDDELLAPYLNDECEFDIYGYIDVSLRDLNTHQPVTANIEIYKKPSDLNVFEPTGLTAYDVNHARFDVPEGYQYQVRVMNTISQGYLPPAPVNVQSLNTNIVIDLEYSSELNSGDVNVNVYRQSSLVSNAFVFLYYGSGDNKDTLVDSTPKITNMNGLVNFSCVPANNDYYAHGISYGQQTLSGISDTEALDANETIDLSVTLEPVGKVLNLNVNTNDYDVMFFDVYGDVVYSYTEIETQDGSQFIFTGDELKIYALITSSSLGAYLTDQIILKDNAEITKTILLETSSSCPSTKITFVGLFDKNTGEEIDKIDLLNNGLENNKYVQRYKYKSCNNDSDYEYAFVRTGKNITSNNDALYIDTISLFPSEDIDITTGTRYAGELDDWNFTHYSDNYDLDHSSSSSETKWAKINFTSFLDYDVTTYEFSVGLGFSNFIFPKDDYVSYYRSLSQQQESFSFDPGFNHQYWNIRPQGFFYAPSTKTSLNFETENLYDFYFYDDDGDRVETFGDSYLFYFYEDGPAEYMFDLYVLYLMNNDIGDYSLGSDDTENNLLYNNYEMYKSGQEQPTQQTFTPPVNNFVINDIEASFGSDFDISSEFSVSGFFSNTSQPKVRSTFFNEQQNINVLSYLDGDYQTIITTDGYDNQIYFGENNLSFEVYDTQNEPVPNVIVKRMFIDGGFVDVCTTDEDGYCEAQDPLVVNNIDLISEYITFKFILYDVGAPNNTIAEINKQICSGYVVLDSEENVLTDNVIDYQLAIVKSGNNFFLNNLSDTYYYIKNLTSTTTILEELSFIGGGDVINVNDTNQELLNNVPKDLESVQNTQIDAPVILNLSQSSFENTTGLFRHLIGLDLGGTSSTYNLLDLNVNVNIDYIDVGGGVTNYNYAGIYDKGDNQTGVELIKDYINERTINYNFTNNSSEKIQITGVSVDDSDIVSTDNIISSITSSLTQNGEFKEILPSDSEDINILVVRESYHPVGEEDLNITISFIYDPDGSAKEYTLPINLFVKVFNKSNTISASVGAWTSNPVNCYDGDCSLQAQYAVTNNTKSYNLEYLETEIDAGDLDYLFTTTDASPLLLSLDGDEQRNLTIVININSDEVSEDDIFENQPISVENKFVVDIFNNNYDIQTSFTKNHVFTIYNSEPMLSIPDLDGTMCVGYGGKLDQTNFVIIGNCDQPDEGCLTGYSAVPMLEYDWTTTGSYIGSDTGCVVDNISDQANMYCDSTQLLINMFYNIKNNGFSDFYIDLMSDSVSSNLLDDFIDCAFTNNTGESSCDFQLNNLLTESQDVSDLVDFIGDNSYNISRNNNEPGRYLVKFNDFDLEDNNLNIEIVLARHMSLSKKNLFYYLPINLPLLAYSENRDYGLNIDLVHGVLELNNNNKIDNTTNETLENSDIPQLNIQTYTNNLQKSLENKEKVLSISKDYGTDNIIYNLSFVPSKPSVIYAKSACVSTNNLSYVLTNLQNEITVVDHEPLLVWKDVHDNNIHEDQISQNISYNYHFLNIPASNQQNKLLKTNLFLPKDLESNQYKLLLEHLNLTNHEDTVFYKLDNNDVQESKENTLSINQAYTDVEHLKILFDLISEQKICMTNKYNSTELFWTDEVLDVYNETEEGLIINHADLDNTFGCSTQSQ